MDGLAATQLLCNRAPIRSGEEKSMVTIELDIDIPKNCYECPLGMVKYMRGWRFDTEQSKFACALTGKNMTSTKRNRFCPMRGEEHEG